ncbi:pyrimidine utilization protein A [Poseidonocella sedimentorum]|uniref:Pyrimidine monooxygenase RutA n=1 Tax=Poseidonocella sedimentorum TaxID=871652 RepID=A0A1I6E3G4_9RHOB|nr:pyrimidine utilization protein A [Poseidonocella sedimentorum]SFR12236.1 pyrimidine oxygenase [Poseidonocella sedimentorum]
MEIGVFLPIGNNGWLLSRNAPQYKPSYELNKSVVLRAEAMGMEFALSMIKLHGFDGETEFWNYNLESFTMIATIAPSTSRIKLFASTAVLTLPPAVVARMAVTIDNCIPGRFGVNIVSGWQAMEYSQMGLWPGNDYFGYRYDYATEYVEVMRRLWSEGRIDYAGEHFTMEDCMVLPKPSGGQIPIVCAGQSDRGMEFAAQWGDYNFCLGDGINTPTAHADKNYKLLEATRKTGRDVGAYVLFMIIADETDEAAFARWESYQAGLDVEAAANVMGRAAEDVAGDGVNKAMQREDRTVNMNVGALIGSFENVARMLDEAAEVAGTKGIMLVFDDYYDAMDTFAERVQPLMACRADRLAAIAAE